MAVRYAVFFAVALLVMGGAHYYVWARLVRDASLPGAWPRVAAVAIIVLFALMMSGFMAFRALPRSVATPIMWVGYTWLGVLFFLFLAIAATDLVRVFALRSAPEDPERRLLIMRVLAGAAALFGFGASGIALASALSRVKVAKVNVTLTGLTAPAKIVQITDVHVGPTIGKDFIEAIVASVNALEPDVIAITGDLVDGTVDQLKDHVAPLAKLRAKHGVYFVTGNHEYYSGAEEWIRHLATLGIRVLRNEHVRIGGEDGFDLAGIDDHSARPDLRRALAGRDGSRACVLLAHQPRGIELANELGVGLQLSGHTHGGQMFPWGFAVRLQQPFVAGLHKLSRAQIYVSRGTGYWGPPMRLGAPAEISEIDIVPARAPT
jgi:predicted MPP superfamily phosphohydrolase